DLPAQRPATCGADDGRRMMGSVRGRGASRGGPSPVGRADIVIADSTNRYDGRDLTTRPLGGTETSVIQLAEALAQRGHTVTAYTRTAAHVVHTGVTWRPLTSTAPVTCTLLLAVQQPELLGVVRRPRRRALWIVWPASGLRRLHRARRLWRYRPWPVLV